jgi:hypothetical protein
VPEDKRATIVRRSIAIIAIAIGIALVLVAKRDGLTTLDAGWKIDVEQEWSLRCKDGTRGVYIGGAIKIEGCDEQPTHRALPVR